MKNLFLLLLLANLCVGLWLHSIESERIEKNRLPEIKADVARLLLLSEVAPSLKPAEPVQPPPVAEPAPEVAVAAPLAEEPVSTEQVAATGAEPSAAVETAATQPVPEPEPEVVVAKVCRTLGPFVEVAKARRAARLIAGAGAEVERRSSQEQEPYGYRVFIPPLSSRQRAYKVATELRQKKVKDYFVITNPNDKVNGISLGLFSQKTGALKRVAQMRNLGYQASIEIRYKDKEIFWLDYVAQEGSVDDQVLREAGEGVTDIQLLPRTC